MTAPRTIATLTRFDRVFPGEVMPADLKSLSFAAQMALKDADPALYEVLAGRMDSGTEAALLSGTWPDVAPAGPTPEQMRAEQVAQLTQLNPFAPTSRNLSAQLQLEAIDPQAAAQQRALAQPYLALEQANAATAARQREQALAEGRNAHQNATAISAARQRLASGVF
jgi:hypothetical protein